MNVVEATALLKTCSGYDNRKPNDDAPDAWATALYDVTLEDATKAVHVHYRDSVVFVMPGHVRAIVRRVKEARWKAHGPLDTAAAPPPALDGDARGAVEWTRAYRRAVGNGATREQADLYACEELGVTRPRQVEKADPGAVRRLIEGAGPKRPPRADA